MSPKGMLVLSGLAATVLAGDEACDRTKGEKCNVLGTKLQRCSHPGMALTGWTRDGRCIDRNNDAGSHHICIDLSDMDGGNFCTVTGQSNWCSSQMPCDGQSGRCQVHNWCVCQWAFRKYIHKAGGCDKIQRIECEAINAVAVEAYMKFIQNPGRASAEEVEGTRAALECIHTRCIKPQSTAAAAASKHKAEEEGQNINVAVNEATTPAPYIKVTDAPTPKPAVPATVAAPTPKLAVPATVAAANKPTTNIPSTADKLAAQGDEGTSSTGTLVMAILGGLSCLTVSGGLALVMVSRKNAAQASSAVTDLSQPLPDVDETEGSI